MTDAGTDIAGEAASRSSLAPLLQVLTLILLLVDTLDDVWEH